MTALYVALAVFLGCLVRFWWREDARLVAGLNAAAAILAAVRAVESALAR
ncbi:MAG TPA: hypothetical protein VF406_16130 [Thermodesulfobacteriota bacterium]